ncbi:hypothetical protein DT603_11670 [Pseudoxanthomonas gei]|uniref:Sugar transporter n=1 Tax=Pseudoxanthomonas gei TaxID=1383030 RepID=A0ABX0ADJ8_9GAMM|nr:hypothetical protein [Pseudoxanthomonas gei]NDK39501.1 hypothetical protein [Pseudoxanthomonas gei]
MQTATKKAPWHLWVVGVIAVLFNAIGVFDFVMGRIQGPAYMASAGMTPEQIAYYQQLPAWMMFVWALGVFAAFAASVLLLLRRRAAAPVFAVSLAAFLVSLLHTYVLTDGGAVMGQQMAITSTVIAVLLFLFCLYAWWGSKRLILR